MDERWSDPGNLRLTGGSDEQKTGVKGTGALDDSVDRHSDETIRKKAANSGKGAEAASSDLQTLVQRLEYEIAERRRVEEALRRVRNCTPGLRAIE